MSGTEKTILLLSIDFLDDLLIVYLLNYAHRTTQNTAYGVIGPVENSARARGGQTSGKYIIYINLSVCLSISNRGSAETI